MNTSNFIWVEKYRPQTLSEMILTESARTVLENILSSEHPDNLILYGLAGTGKTTIAKIIVNHFDGDYLFINGSDERGIDVVRDKVRKFAYSQSMATRKFVIYNEADQITPEAQASLKDIIEESHDNATFIFTTNNINKMDDAIKSRCILLNILPDSKKDIAKYIVDILKKENVKFTVEDIKTLVIKYAPDVRKCVRMAQAFSRSGEFSFSQKVGDNYGDRVLEYIKNSKKTGVKSIYPELYGFIANLTHDDLRGLYPYLFNSCNTLFFTETAIITAMSSCAEYNRTATLAIDFVIHTIAMIVSLIEIYRNES